MENETAVVRITLPDGEEITSESKNKKTAKANAAKKALIQWKNKNISL